MNNEDNEILKEIAKKSKLTSGEEAYLNFLNENVAGTISFLNAIKNMFPEISEATNTIVLSSIFAFISKDRDDMFALLEKVRKSLEQVDMTIVKGPPFDIHHYDEEKGE